MEKARLLVDVDEEPLQFPLSEVAWPSIGSTLTLHDTWGCCATGGGWGWGSGGFIEATAGLCGKKLGVRVRFEPQLEEAEPQWLLPTELRLWPPRLTFLGIGIMLGWCDTTPLTVGLISVKSGIWSQGCFKTTSRLGLRLASVWRHFRIRSWHSAESLVRNRSSARQICSSVSKGISPQTMSYNKIPRLHTVASSPL